LTFSEKQLLFQGGLFGTTTTSAGGGIFGNTSTSTGFGGFGNTGNVSACWNPK